MLISKHTSKYIKISVKGPCKSSAGPLHCYLVISLNQVGANIGQCNI